MMLHPKEPIHKVLEKSATVMLIVLTTALHAAGVRSTCETRSVNAGDPVNLTCHFDHDIKKLELDVHVNRRKPKKLNVFKCAWFNGECLVTIMPGVLLVGNISNILNLMITQANESHAGTYMCQVARSGENDTSPCTLNVSSIANGSQATVMIPMFPNVSSNAGKELDRNQTSATVIVFSVLSGLIAVITLLIIIIRKGPWKTSQPCYKHICGSSSSSCTGCKCKRNRRMRDCHAGMPMM